MFALNKLSLLSILMLVICLFVGCGNNQFGKDLETFKSSYVKITDVLDPKEPFLSIEKLNQDPILKEINELENTLQKMQQGSSSEYEKNVCEKLAKFYSGLEFLQYAANNPNNLSEDERGRIATELTLVSMNRISIKEGGL